MEEFQYDTIYKKDKLNAIADPLIWRKTPHKARQQAINKLTFFKARITNLQKSHSEGMPHSNFSETTTNG